MTTECYRDEYKKKDGTISKVEELKYYCYHKSRKLCECDGRATYKAVVIDGSVSEVIKNIFKRVQVIPDKHVIAKNIRQLVQSNAAEQKKRWREIEKAKLKLKKLQKEIANALIGESSFEPEMLAATIEQTKENLKQMEEMYHANQADIEAEKNKFSAIVPNFEKFKSWAGEFEMASLERKKAITNLLIRSVDVSRDGITIQFNIDYQQFLSEWENEIIPFDKVETA